MGEASDGSDFPSPLTTDQRAEIIARLERLPENVRGNDVPKLVSLVEHALTPWALDLDDESALADFGVPSEAAFEQLSTLIEKRFNDLLKAARELADLTGDETLQQSAESAAQYPWLENVAHFDGWARERVEGEPDGPAMLKEGLRLLLQLRLRRPDGLRRGRRPLIDDTRQIVRAVAVYMEQELGLKFERSWPAGAATEANKDQRGGAMEPASYEGDPPTRTVELIEAVLNAFGLPVVRTRIRSSLIAYAQELAGRPPSQADFLQLTTSVSHENANSDKEPSGQ